jgi:hypothetical protein
MSTKHQWNDNNMGKLGQQKLVSVSKPTTNPTKKGTGLIPVLGGQRLTA